MDGNYFFIQCNLKTIIVWIKYYFFKRQAILIYDNKYQENMKYYESYVPCTRKNKEVAFRNFVKL